MVPVQASLVKSLLAGAPPTELETMRAAVLALADLASHDDSDVAGTVAFTNASLRELDTLEGSMVLIYRMEPSIALAAALMPLYREAGWAVSFGMMRDEDGPYGRFAYSIPS